MWARPLRANERRARVVEPGPVAGADGPQERGLAVRQEADTGRGEPPPRPLDADGR